VKGGHCDDFGGNVHRRKFGARIEWIKSIPGRIEMNCVAGKMVSTGFIFCAWFRKRVVLVVG
jgi:hypothetical protein